MVWYSVDRKGWNFYYMLHIYNSVQEVSESVLTDGRLYLYVLQNDPQKNIKIGRTTNPKQRFLSLSGSNTGGNQIVKIAVTEPTYLYVLERIVHQYFRRYRVPGTEWFSDLSFDTVCDYLNDVFVSKEYWKCNEVRREFTEIYGAVKKNFDEEVPVRWAEIRVGG